MSFYIPNQDLEFVDPFQDKYKDKESFKSQSLFEVKKQLLLNKIIQECGTSGRVYGFSNKKVGELLNLKQRQAHKYMKQLEKEGKIHIRVKKYFMASVKKWVNDRIVSVSEINHPETKRLVEQVKSSITYHHKKKIESRKKIAKRLAVLRKEALVVPKIKSSPYAVDFSSSVYKELETAPKKFRPRMATTKIPHIIEDMTDDYNVEHELEKIQNFIKRYDL